MILDSSVFLRILYREPGWEDLLRTIRAASFAGAGTPTLAETAIALHHRLGDQAAGMLEGLLDDLDIKEIQFGEGHWREAVSAFRRFGKGRHPARLNFDDCLTYATASLSGEPLLYVGDDFALTDLERA